MVRMKIAGFGNCDHNKVNGCEIKLSDKNWVSCNTCIDGYSDCDGDSSNGCESKLSDNGLSNCENCASGYTECGNNKFISYIPFCVHVISPNIGPDGKKYWINDCSDHCNGTGITKETITRAQCSPAQSCYRTGEGGKTVVCQ